MRRPCVALLAALAAPGCEPTPPTTNKSPPTIAPIIKEPPRILLGVTGLNLGDHRTAIPRVVADAARAELAEALMTLRDAHAPQTAPWLVEVEPDTPAGSLTAVVAAAHGLGVALRYADVGSSTGIALAARTIPDPKTTPTCNETGVVVGRGMTWVGRFEMRVDAHGIRRAHPPEPDRGVLDYLDSQDPDQCRRLGGRPERIDLAALTAAVAAMSPAAPACGPVRVAVHREIEWARVAPILRKLGEAGPAPALVDEGGATFAGCGIGAFVNGPAFDLHVSDKQGPLEDSAIDQVAINHGPETDACLAHEPPRLPDSEQPPHHVVAEIGPDGQVIVARPKDPKDPVATCLATAIAAWKFPSPRAATPTVKFTIGY